MDRKLIVVPEEAKTVRKIFQRFIEVQSPKLIAQELNSEGIKPKYAKEWNMASVYNILNNHTYNGEVKYKDSVCKGEQAAIVKPEVWLRTREILKCNTRISSKGRRMVEVLSELLRCREDPVEVIPDRLWKMGKSGVAIDDWSRDIYFATRMTQRNTQETYDRLPDSKTPLLIVGSSHLLPDLHGRYDDNLVVMLDSILIPEKDKCSLVFEWLNTLANDAPEETPEQETREATGATVEAIKKALHTYLEAAFRNYCEQIRKGNGAQMPKPALTLTTLANMVGKDKSRVSRLLELRKPLDQCKHVQIRIQWESTQDITMMTQYAKKYWGRKYRGWE